MVPHELRREFRALAESAGRELSGARAVEILAWAFDQFKSRICVAASMADAVVVHLASQVHPGVEVIFLDTGYHFAETLETARRVRRSYPISLREVRPHQTVVEQDAMFGPRLHDRDPDACCTLRKVEPLQRALAPHHAWVTGIRRDETAARREAGVVEWDGNRAIVKVNPIATWSQSQVDRYIAEHDIVVNPLLAAGYPSIGCAPCTRRVGEGGDPRSGRWAGSSKTECGLHARYADQD